MEKYENLISVLLKYEFNFVVTGELKENDLQFYLVKEFEKLDDLTGNPSNFVSLVGKNVSKFIKEYSHSGFSFETLVTNLNEFDKKNRDLNIEFSDKIPWRYYH